MLAAVAGAAERFLLLLVLAAAAAGVAVPAPGRAVSAANGIDAALAVLVFATGLSLRAADLAAVRAVWRRVAVVLVVSTAILPALAWAASQLIGDPVLRSGMQTVGVAPAEVATVALCVIAGGEAAVCAVLLVASTIVTVLAAGPVLSVLGAAVTVSAAGLISTRMGGAGGAVAGGSSWRCRWRRGWRGVPSGHLGSGWMRWCALSRWVRFWCCCGRSPARSGSMPPTPGGSPRWSAT